MLDTGTNLTIYHTVQDPSYSKWREMSNMVRNDLLSKPSFHQKTKGVLNLAMRSTKVVTMEVNYVVKKT